MSELDGSELIWMTEAVHILACPRWDEVDVEDCIHRPVHEEDAAKRGSAFLDELDRADPRLLDRLRRPSEADMRARATLLTPEPPEGQERP